MDAVLFSGLIEGPDAAVALHDPHAPRELRAGVHPAEAFRLMRAHDRGALALVRWHGVRSWRVAVTTEMPPAKTRATWRRLEDQWIEVGPSGTAVVATVDRFADPDGDGASSVDGAGDDGAAPGEFALAPGRYRVARFDRRALVQPLDEGFETLYPGEHDVADAGPGARQDSPEVAIVFTLTPLAPGEPAPSPHLGAVRGWKDAVASGDLDARALGAQFLAGASNLALTAAALAELATPEAIAILRRAAVSEDARLAAAAQAAVRVYHIGVGGGLPRRRTRI